MKRKYSAPMAEKIEFRYCEQVVASGKEFCNGNYGFEKAYDASKNCISCSNDNSNNY